MRGELPDARPRSSGPALRISAGKTYESGRLTSPRASALSIVYPVGLAGAFKGSRICKRCGAKVVGTDPTNLSINYAAHMRLHEPRQAPG
jgi:hypothetical protein